tara:strand:- start:303 stop:644 length:342 start_codon:yes stop_codon:yes gene_type:complete
MILINGGYLASNNELINSLGSDTKEAVKNYISWTFTRQNNKFIYAQSYLNNYADLKCFGSDKELATKHYVEYGFNEGKSLYIKIKYLLILLIANIVLPTDIKANDKIPLSIFN